MVRDTAEHFAQIGFGIDLIELGGFNERMGGCRALPTSTRADWGSRLVPRSCERMPPQNEGAGAEAVTSATSWAEMPSRSTRSKLSRPTLPSSSGAGKRTVRPSSPGARPQAMTGMASGPSPGATAIT